MNAVIVVYRCEKGLPRNSGSMESYRVCRLLLGNLETWTKSSYGLGSFKFIGCKQLLPTSRIHLGASNKGYLHGAITCWSALCADLKQLGGPTSDSSIPHHTLRATILNRNCDRNGAGNMTIRNARTSITAVARGAAPKSTPHQFVR